MSVAKLLKAIQENPDDLSKLPEIIAKVEEMEASEMEYQERIHKLQEINKSYLAQIPIPGNEPKEKEKPSPTLEDARQHIINTIAGGNQ